MPGLRAGYTAGRWSKRSWSRRWWLMLNGTGYSRPYGESAVWAVNCFRWHRSMAPGTYPGSTVNTKPAVRIYFLATPRAPNNSRHYTTLPYWSLFRLIVVYTISPIIHPRVKRNQKYLSLSLPQPGYLSNRLQSFEYIVNFLLILKRPYLFVFDCSTSIYDEICWRIAGGPVSIGHFIVRIWK